MKKQIYLCLLFILSGLSGGYAQLDQHPQLAGYNDTIHHKFVFILNGGFSIPGNDYGKPSSDYQPTNPSKEIYGYSSTGLHVDLTGVYSPIAHFGLAVRYGWDINSPQNFVNQYMAGLYVSANPKKSKSNVYFLGLIGLVTLNDLNSDNYYFKLVSQAGATVNWLEGNEIPGFGTGVGFYGGAGISSNITKRLCFSCSLGYLISDIGFSNGIVLNSDVTVVGSNYISTSTFSQKFMLMTLGIFQANFGLRYQL